MKLSRLSIFLVAVVVVGAAYALLPGKAVVVAQPNLKWKELGIPGVSAAVVSGNMSKGPSRFFLKYPAGFVTPVHHHTADHYATVISGNLTLRAGGKEYKLSPGSYFSLMGKMAHVAIVEGSEPAVFFIQADGPWDAKMH